MSRSLVKQGEQTKCTAGALASVCPSDALVAHAAAAASPSPRGACAQETLHLAAWRKWCALPPCAPCAPRASRHGVCTPGWLVVTPVCLPARAA
jgi:hypothetical protein